MSDQVKFTDPDRLRKLALLNFMGHSIEEKKKAPKDAPPVKVEFWKKVFMEVSLEMDGKVHVPIRSCWKLFMDPETKKPCVTIVYTDPSKDRTYAFARIFNSLSISTPTWIVLTCFPV